ncbi:MAG: UDP-N-acetyl-D-glucosamine dehydrogenase [Paenibacillaceae bacterium]|nr:UDP-N-acetyl-D-glucosamine dehydrogenase [Paenibacillaceae bacterium]
MELLAKIEQRTAGVAVIGLGYVGLPLSVEFARAGYTVYGIDSDAHKIAMLKKGNSYILDTDSSSIGELTAGGALQPSMDYDALEQADIAVLCVPTPLDHERNPDISFIEAAISRLIPRLKRGSLVILESTTYPGTTRELIAGRIEAERGWRAGRDFFACFSPERVDPGNRRFSIRSMPKIIGGRTPSCLEAGQSFYGTVFDRVVPVSSNETAEFAKLLENTFRNVNIALVNELAPVCEAMGVSIWEVVEAAATKPFGYMPFYPGPGIGGHCIPVDPLYLAWKSGQLGMPLKLIGQADEINRGMPAYVVQHIKALLEREGKTIRGAAIILSGLAYKRDTDDLRESPALEILGLLRRLGAHTAYHDPHIPACRIEGEQYVSQAAAPSLWAESDLTVITADHAAVDYQQIADHAPLVFDTRHATKGCKGGRIILLGSHSRTGREQENAQ